MDDKKMIKYAIIVALVVGIIWMFSDNVHFKEGLTHRLTTTNELLPLIYSTGMVESPYYQKWEYDVEKPLVESYSDMYACEKACENVLGETPHQDCIEYCQNQTLFANQGVLPSNCDQGDCADDKICIRPGFYNNGQKYCLDHLEPGVPLPATLRPGFGKLTPAWSPLTPGFAPLTPGMARTNPVIGDLTPAWGQIVPKITPPPHVDSILSCPPMHFYNHVAGECQPRMQN